MITLTLDLLSITVLAFMEAKPPRMRLEKAESQRSSRGALVAYGPAYELPFMWEVQALMTLGDWVKLELLAYEHDDRRRRFQDCDILCVDTFQPVREKSPRSRALAPNTTVKNVAPNYIEYFAQFNVWLGRNPELIETVKYGAYGDCVIVQLSLQETDQKVLP